MAEYKIIKACVWCKKRMVLMKSESNKYFCDDCQKKYEKKLQSENP